MRQEERTRLLLGPYNPPPLKKGERAYCLLRDCDVVITGWTDARIPWPRCRALDSRGGSGLLVNETLARAIRNESAVAIQYWWGDGLKAVWAWREAFGVGRMDSKGSRRLILAASKRGAQTMALYGLPDAVCDQMSERAKRQNLASFLRKGYHGPWWTQEELRLLGTEPDEELAARIGRSTTAVRVMRIRRGIPRFVTDDVSRSGSRAIFGSSGITVLRS